MTPSKELHQATISISGRVQGIGFRFWVKRQADAAGITGFVSNESDGNVRIEAYGKKKELEQLVGRARQGSPWSRVDAVEVEYADTADEPAPKMFEIR